jgi:16S rRNA (guanine(966)-N(2))-methyltransferase RsmD
MRIVAGIARGRALLGPKSNKIRPTADRVRETIFNVLGQSMEGRKVLDLFAGTGALALEALSRGAKSAVLVDIDREALRLCRANAESLQFAKQVQILALPVDRALKKLRSQKEVFDLIFADPPYSHGVATAVLEKLASGELFSGRRVAKSGAVDFLAREGTLCIEHDKREILPTQIQLLERVDVRKFGDTVVSFFRPCLTPS